MSEAMIDQIVRQQEEITKLRQQRDELVCLVKKAMMNPYREDTLSFANYVETINAALAKIEVAKS